MIRFCRTVLRVCFGVVVLTPCFAQSPQDFTSDVSFLSFLERVAEARYQFNLGKVEQSLALWSPTEDVTLMGAGGGMEKGITEVRTAH